VAEVEAWAISSSVSSSDESGSSSMGWDRILLCLLICWLLVSSSASADCWDFVLCILTIFGCAPWDRAASLAVLGVGGLFAPTTGRVSNGSF
jgi:type IV secretory pathway VirB2 component (pilin)